MILIKEQTERQNKFLQELKLDKQIEKFRIREIKELEKWANDPDDTSVPLSSVRTTSDEDVEAGQEIIFEGNFRLFFGL